MMRGICAAACAAALVGMLSVPVESSAKRGGFAGHGRGFHPAVRPMHRLHRPFVPAHRTPLTHAHRTPFVHPHRTPLLHHHRLAHHPFHPIARRHHRAIYGGFGYGYGFTIPVTYGDDDSFYGSYYDPSDATGVMPAAAPVLPPASVMPLSVRAEATLERGGCRSETVPFPSAGGAERSVTITRC
jgi:hypothetical protein